MIPLTWYKIQPGYKRCSSKSCENPYKPLKRFSKDSSQPDKLSRFCKDCLKESRKKHKKKYASSQTHNQKEYKAVKIEDAYKRAKCLRYNDDGTPCKRKPEKGSFCPRCTKRRQYIIDEHEMLEEYGVDE